MISTGGVPLEYDLETLDRAMRGEIRVSLLGEPLGYRLRGKALDGFGRAKACGYLLTRDSTVDNPLMNCFRFWCEAVRRPVVTVCPRRGRLDVKVDWITAGGCPDLDCELRLRAYLGIGMSGQLDPRTYHPTDWFLGQGLAGDADEVGSAVAAIVADGLSRLAARGLEPRPVDWEAVAGLWESRLGGSRIGEAARRGYFVARNVEETFGYFAYRDYCEVACRPVIRVRTRRGRSEIDARGPRRRPIAIPPGLVDELRAMIGETGRDRDAHVLAADGGRLVLRNVRPDVAERVAARLSEALSQAPCAATLLTEVRR